MSPGPRIPPDSRFFQGQPGLLGLGGASSLRRPPRKKRSLVMPATDRVKQILSWYGSDNPGVKANLYRLMSTGNLAGTGKFVILPVDQGFEHGPARSFAPNPE